MTTPRLTIGLPVYNGANYLAEAVTSILSQDFEDFELIISDNASDDDTADICRDFAARDKRVRYERQVVNVGAAPNYNLLLPLARGEYFRWAAHDDNLLQGCLSRPVDTLDTDPEVMLAYPLTSVIDGNGDEIGLFDDGLDLPDPTPDERLVRYLKQNFMRHRGLCNPIFGVMRTEPLRRTRLIQDFLASDLILLAHLALLGKFVAIPEVLFERRVHPGISTAAHKSHADRKAWFNTSARGGSRLFDNEVALRITHIRNLYQAINELVPDATERQKCRHALTGLLIRDPKWLYTDIKYSLGFRPSWKDSAKKIAANKRSSSQSAASHS
ncbi:MAG: glycosyltransferase family 2 protein [Paracoccaceae bacterium]